MSAAPTLENVRGACYSVISDIKHEAEQHVAFPSYLAQTDERRAEVALAAASRIAEFRCKGTELAALYFAEVDSRARLAGIDKSPETAVARFEAFGSLLAPEPAEYKAGEAEYGEAEALILRKESQRARLTALPRGYSVAELLSARFPTPIWVVPEILTTGLTILAGAPKLGKSWLALALGTAVGSGGAVLGRYRVEKRSALYIPLEDTPRRLQNRLQKINAASSSLLRVYPKWRSGAEGLADLDAYLTEDPAKLVLIDTYAGFRGPPATDDRYAADYSAASAIKDIADAHDCAIVLIHHTRKMAAEDVMDMVSGTNGLNGAADATWILSRARGEADATLFMTGRDIEERSLALRFDSTLGTWEALGDAAEFAQTRERRDILDELEDGREVKTGDLAKALGKSPQAISNRLRDLEAEGLVYSPKYGHWALKGRVSRETVKDETNQGDTDKRLNDLHGGLRLPYADDEDGDE